MPTGVLDLEFAAEQSDVCAKMHAAMSRCQALLAFCVHPANGTVTLP